MSRCGGGRKGGLDGDYSEGGERDDINVQVKRRASMFVSRLPLFARHTRDRVGHRRPPTSSDSEVQTGTRVSLRNIELHHYSKYTGVTLSYTADKNQGNP